MTREEAIFCEGTYLGENNCVNCKYYATDTCESRESHKMAIAALKAEPCEVTWITNNKGEGVAFKDMPIEKVNKILAIMDSEPCEDAVSREMVMQTLYDHGCEIEIQDAIENLPPSFRSRGYARIVNSLSMTAF